ncbi:MAG: RNA polymerase sigma factor [Candidatus Taylorbacteria bacterium]|nr:RNA polymerase sigma factor [Candidatus Taylorbacteria bacterium]
MLLDESNEKRDLIASMPDEELLERSFSNPRLFEKLLERYEEAFLRKAYYILGTKEAAQDAVQDAFVKIYKNARRFRPQPGAGFKSWGYRILVNTCYTAYKKTKGEGNFLADLDPEFQELVADRGAGERREQELNRDEVESLLKELSGGLAEPMRLHFIEGKPHADVARILQISEGAVRARVHRAKQELKEIMEKRKERSPLSHP